MPQNYKYKYEIDGRHIFVPTDECVRKGDVLISFLSKNIVFPDVFYHYRAGGHIKALHTHIERKFFFRLDIKNFFYSLSRNRVAAALHQSGFKKARTYAKWSCVKNPYGSPAYALPIGFVQSPALASLVLMQSALMKAVHDIEKSGAFISIYLDDLVCSADDIDLLENLYVDTLEACRHANFPINEKKAIKASPGIQAFNCDIKHGFAEVSPERIARFFGQHPTVNSEKAFLSYCSRVSAQNK